MVLDLSQSQRRLLLPMGSIRHRKPSPFDKTPTRGGRRSYIYMCIYDCPCLFFFFLCGFVFGRETSVFWSFPVESFCLLRICYWTGESAHGVFYFFESRWVGYGRFLYTFRIYRWELSDIYSMGLVIGGGWSHHSLFWLTFRSWKSGRSFSFFCGIKGMLQSPLGSELLGSKICPLRIWRRMDDPTNNARFEMDGGVFF